MARTPHFLLSVLLILVSIDFSIGFLGADFNGLFEVGPYNAEQSIMYIVLAYSGSKDGKDITNSTLFANIYPLYPVRLTKDATRPVWRARVFLRNNGPYYCAGLTLFMPSQPTIADSLCSLSMRGTVIGVTTSSLPPILNLTNLIILQNSTSVTSQVTMSGIWGPYLLIYLYFQTPISVIASNPVELRRGQYSDDSRLICPECMSRNGSVTVSVSLPLSGYASLSLLQIALVDSLVTASTPVIFDQTAFAAADIPTPITFTPTVLVSTTANWCINTTITVNPFDPSRMPLCITPNNITFIGFITPADSNLNNPGMLMVRSGSSLTETAIVLPAPVSFKFCHIVYSLAAVYVFDSVLMRTFRFLHNQPSGQWEEITFDFYPNRNFGFEGSLSLQVDPAFPAYLLLIDHATGNVYRCLSFTTMRLLPCAVHANYCALGILPSKLLITPHYVFAFEDNRDGFIIRFPYVAGFVTPSDVQMINFNQELTQGWCVPLLYDNRAQGILMVRYTNTASYFSLFDMDFQMIAEAPTFWGGNVRAFSAQTDLSVPTGFLISTSMGLYRIQYANSTFRDPVLIGPVGIRSFALYFPAPGAPATTPAPSAQTTSTQTNMHPTTTLTSLSNISTSSRAMSATLTSTTAPAQYLNSSASASVSSLGNSTTSSPSTANTRGSALAITTAQPGPQTTASSSTTTTIRQSTSRTTTIATADAGSSSGPVSDQATLAILISLALAVVVAALAAYVWHRRQHESSQPRQQRSRDIF